MDKIRVVLDTNVLISAAFRIQPSVPDQILRALKSQNFIHIVSLEILEEIKEVINRKEITKRTGMNPKERDQFMRDIIDTSYMVSGSIVVHAVSHDPDDDKFIAAALEGNADYIVSGDKHLLSLKEYKGIKILPPRELVKVLE